MLNMLYMAQVTQIIGAILLIAIGVGVILYTLLRKSPVVAEPEADAEETAPDGADTDAEETAEESEPAEDTSRE